MKKVIIIIQTILILVSYQIGRYSTSAKSYKDVGGNIDIEYYLEVSEDSIWVEGVDSKKVYSGSYDNLRELIIKDNQ